MYHANAARFMELCRGLDIPETTADTAYLDLEKRYTEPHRAYHNRHHIDRMLAALDATGEIHDALELAIWYHDVVYVPLAPDNEAQSADLFAEHIGACLPAKLVAEIVRLILATDPRRPRTGHPDEDRIIDIDLSILGASPEDYDAYRHAVRQEYAMVPDAAFAAGRKKILQHFLERPIYATPAFAHLEAAAQQNLQREVEALGG